MFFPWRRSKRRMLLQPAISDKLTGCKARKLVREVLDATITDLTHGVMPRGCDDTADVLLRLRSFLCGSEDDQKSPAD